MLFGEHEDCQELALDVLEDKKDDDLPDEVVPSRRIQRKSFIEVECTISRGDEDDD